jgi:hypothetical protein
VNDRSVAPAQIAHVLVDNSRIAIERKIPDTVEELCSRQHAALVDEELAQKAELGGRQMHRFTAARHFVRVVVKHKVTASQATVRGLATLSQPELHASDQLSERERLDHVVGSTSGEATYTITFDENSFDTGD